MSSCSVPKPDINRDTEQIKELKTAFLKSYFDSIEIKKESFKMKLKGCYLYDSLKSGNMHCRIPQYQIISLYKNDLLIFEKYQNTNVRYIKIYSGYNIPIMEIEIYKIGVIGSGKNILFSLDGTCHCYYIEYSELINLEGKTVWNNYYNKETGTVSNGNLLEILKKYRIPDTVYIRRKFPVVKW